MQNWHASYGDWVPADPNAKVSNSLCAAYNYITNVAQLAEVAAALNMDADAQTLQQLVAELQKEYTTAFYNAATQCYDKCGQASTSFGVLTVSIAWCTRRRRCGVHTPIAVAAGCDPANAMAVVHKRAGERHHEHVQQPSKPRHHRRQGAAARSDTAEPVARCGAAACAATVLTAAL